MRTLPAFLILLLASLAQLAATALPVASLAGVLPPLPLPALWQEPMMLPMTLGLAIGVAVVAALSGGLLVAPALWRHSAWWLVPILLPLLWQAALWTSASSLPSWVSLVGHAAIGLGLGALLGQIGLSALPDDTLRTGAMNGLSALGTLRRVIWPAARMQTALAVILALLALLPEHWSSLHQAAVSLPVRLHAML